MKHFTKAIVRTPCPSMVNGITSANLGEPDYKLALKQHKNYIKALEYCGLQVTVLEANDLFPDSTFVEDVALCTPYNAIITNPGAKSRKNEIHSIIPVIEKHYDSIEQIESPATVEAGDILMVGNFYYIGLSQRTNLQGANQTISFLKKYGMNGKTVKMEEFLHLKTGLSYLEDRNLLVNGEFVDHPIFNQFNTIVVDNDESYAANSVWVNNKVIVPAGFEKTREKIQRLGYETLEIDVSEFQKLDGGLSCLSLRF